MTFVTRGFRGRRRGEASPERVPPGQYVTEDYPVLSAGPTPRVELAAWRLAITSGDGELAAWSWEGFNALATETVQADIHCVTKWSKLETTWEGVAVDTLLAGIDVGQATHVLVHAYGGYTTNLPLADVTGGRAWVAHRYEGRDLAPEHGGPARLLVPHLYLWKSAKWVNRLELLGEDRPGFWESLGYHNYGDPWREQRYSGD